MDNKSKNIEFIKPKKKHTNFRLILSKLSGGFMLPISLLAFSGIFLGVGSAIVSSTSDGSYLQVLGHFIQAIGNTVFGILPLLFAISMALTFSNQSGISAFSAVVLWFGMNSISSVFLLDHNGNYSILGLGSLWGNISRSLIVKNAGINSFSTSIFGAIMAGGFAAFACNKFSTTKLPTFLGFFSGIRFVPIVSLIISIFLGIALIFIWPIFGFGLYKFGVAIGSLHYGISAFIFGIVERSLIPFGLHHVFYAPLWWSSAGGLITDHSLTYSLWLAAGGKNSGLIIPNTLQDIINGKDYPKWMQDDARVFQNGFSSKMSRSGNINIWFWLQSLKQARFHYLSNGTVSTMPIFDWITKFDTKLISPGTFDQGKYPFMIFGLPAASIAMIYTAPKENRKFASSIIVSASATSFLTGITEPIEFTFLFLAPWLFWGIHAPLAGLSFMAMSLSGAHIGMTFSGGILDLIIYGIIPLSLGTHFWWVFIIGPIYSVIYFFLFYFLIKKFNIPTPGRGKVTKLFTKKDWQVKKNKKTKMENLEKEANIVKGYGGYKNITNFANCATRLRYDVKDPKLVNTEIIKKGGAIAVVKVGKSHFQAIIGPSASIVNSIIQKRKNEILEILQEK